MTPVRFICGSIFCIRLEISSLRAEDGDIFVHQSSIKMQGRRELSASPTPSFFLHTPPQFRPSCDCALRDAAQEGQAVEFEVILDEKGRKEAVEVSGAHPIGDFGERSSAHPTAFVSARRRRAHRRR